MEDSKVLMPTEYKSDPWVAAFVCELHMFFGTPVSSGDCKNKTDKLLYVWSLVGISNSLKVEERMWRAMKDRVDPKTAAEKFSRWYWMRHGKMIVEDSPSFAPRGIAPKALTDQKMN